MQVLNRIEVAKMKLILNLSNRKIGKNTEVFNSKELNRDFPYTLVHYKNRNKTSYTQNLCEIKIPATPKSPSFFPLTALLGSDFIFA